MLLHQAKLFPGCKFVVGYDTAVRILNKKYYGEGTASELVKALQHLHNLECSFIVVGRRVGEGAFLTRQDLAMDIPAGFEDMFQEFPNADFRDDTSSTAVRAAGGTL